MLEFEVHAGCTAEEQSIAELSLPRDVLVTAIVREGRSQIVRGRTVLRKGDHVIVVAEPESVDTVARVLG